MEVIPAIDLIGGKCVRLTKGDYAKEKVYADDPVTQARLFRQMGAETLHLVDLDGARLGSSAHLDVIRRIRAEADLTGMRIEFGGGIRNLNIAETALQAGADLLIIGTAAYKNPVLLDELLMRMRESIVVSLDVRNEMVMGDGWKTDSGLNAREMIVTNLVEKGVKRIIYTDTERDGTLEGVGLANKSLEKITLLCGERGIKLSYAGGVGSLEDVRNLRKYERDSRAERKEKFGKDEEILTSVIIGKALYEGRFTLAEAIKAGTEDLA